MKSEIYFNVEKLKSKSYFTRVINFTNVFLIFCFLTLQSFNCFAQAPQAFKYQAIVRNNTGLVIPNQSVNLRISLLQGSATGTQVYSEEHAVTTNTFGLVNLEIGNGTNTTGTFATIDWSTGIYFIKIELDITGGTTFFEMGTTQLLSVPYALFAASGNPGPVGTTGATGSQGVIGLTGVTGATGPQGEMGLTGATGLQGDIGLTGATGATGPQGDIGLTGLTGATGADGALTAWSLTGSSGTIAGTNFIGTTDTNDFVFKTNNFEKMRITSMGNIGIGTTNPTTALHINGTLRITDDTEGPGKIFTSDANGVGSWQIPAIPAIGSSIGSANYIPKFINTNALDNSLIYQNGNRLGVGTINPSGRLMIQADMAALATEPLFEIKDRLGKTVMVVYEDSVHFFVKDDTSGSKTNNRGSFAVSGKSNSKSLTNDFLRINADSTRIYTTDTIKGFGVQNLTGSNKSSYLQLTPLNYFIGHEAGKSITLGKYNSFIGYQSGYKNTSGRQNYFIGYRSGYNNLGGYSNIFIGDSAGFTNTSGNKNVFIGNQSGLNNIGGDYNVFLGYQSGKSNTSDNNSFVGYRAGYSNTSGNNNVFIGKNSGFTNTSGDYNVFLGYNSGYTNNANYNTFLGYQAGYFNSSGAFNVFLGYNAGYNNTASNNIFMGYNAGKNNLDGSFNAFIGYNSGFSNTNGANNIFLGNLSGYSNLLGFSNVFIGNGAGYKNKYAEYDVLIGDSAGFSIVGTIDNNTWPNDYFGNQNIFIGYKAGYNTTEGFWNVMIGDKAGYSATTAKGNIFMGSSSGENNSTGKDNIFMGFWAGKMNMTGNENVVLGTMGDDLGGNISENVFIGYNAGMTSSGNQNVFLGNNAGRSASTASNNVFLGWHAGYTNNGQGNVFIGHDAGAFETGSDKLYIANSPTTIPLIYGDFSSNRIGLGTTNPNSSFHIDASGTEDGLRVQINGSTKLFVDNGGGVTVGSVTIPPANGLYVSGDAGIGRTPTTNKLEVQGDASKTTAGSWLANSDKRIKTDIQEIENSFETILKLKPVKFKYTDEWKKRNPSILDRYYFNFIAQEYQQVFPDAVKGSGEYIDGDNNEILQIDTYDSQIVTIKAVQDLIKENILLKNKILKLEFDNAQLKQNTLEINKLKAEIEKINSILSTSAIK